MINLQKIEKVEDDYQDTLEVHSIFNTIQGEGPFAGWPAVFVRLTGCNLRCPACDTEYTSKRKVYYPEDLAREVLFMLENFAQQFPLVVLTGGEPMRQNLGPFIRSLRTMKMKIQPTVQIETNGTVYRSDFPYPAVHLVCSPKTTIHPDLVKHVKAWKYVVKASEVDADDGLPISVLGNGVKVQRPPKFWSFPSEVYLQAADEQDPERNAANVKAAVESCMKYGYRYSHQIHKLIGLE